MRIAITGASGFVGSEIIPHFEKSGTELLLVGRDTASLTVLYPNHSVCDYQSLAAKAEGFDAVVHLAVLNNHRDSSPEDFHAVNVGLLEEVLESAKFAGIRNFVYLSSFRSQPGNEPRRTGKRASYSQTKAQAERVLSEVSGINVINFRLPAVYGQSYAGRLRLLSKLPKFLADTLFKIAACFRPTVHSTRVASAIIEAVETSEPAEQTLSDRQRGNWVYSLFHFVLNTTFVLVVVVGFWWVLVFAWLAIRLTSGSGPLFGQTRIGRGKTSFTCYKLRTMHPDTVEAGTHEVDTTSLDLLQRFLRRSKIDELPQCLNIIRGEMWLVGPRPCLPSQGELIEERMKRNVLDYPSGITGWSQVNSLDMSMPVPLAISDADYLDRRCIPLDLLILLKTLSVSRKRRR